MGQEVSVEQKGQDTGGESQIRLQLELYARITPRASEPLRSVVFKIGQIARKFARRVQKPKVQFNVEITSLKLLITYVESTTRVSLLLALDL
jgi:hypothetical protein